MCLLTFVSLCIRTLHRKLITAFTLNALFLYTCVHNTASVVKKKKHNIAFSVYCYTYIDACINAILIYSRPIDFARLWMSSRNNA